MFKFLDPSGATYYNGQETVYALPDPGEKWGPWMKHPEPSEPDGQACGPGGYHLMLRPDARYASPNWWPWWAEGEGVIGTDEEKARFQAVRLRRLAPKVWHRIIRLGWCKGAYLRWADLRGADLRGAYLREADLREADLRGANLREADLTEANLREADLRWANLTEANLRGANLTEANLREADLTEANLNRIIGLDVESKEGAARPSAR